MKYKTSEETYRKALEICCGMCVLCGETRGLELHHILGRGRFLTDYLPNCVFLCHNCHHNVVHANLKKYRPILKEISKEMYGVEMIDNPRGSDAVRDLRKIEEAYYGTKKNV